MCRAMSRHAGARIEQRARKVLSRRWRQKYAPRWRTELAVCSCGSFETCCLKHNPTPTRYRSGS